MMLAKFTRLSALTALLTLCAGSAHAAEVFLSPTSVSSWRIQSYVGSNISLYFTGSGCGPYGSLNLPTTASTEERERLWSVMTAAKLSGKRVFVYFDNGIGTGAAPCGTIRSFGYLE